VIREDASKSVSDHGARDSARLKRNHSTDNKRHDDKSWQKQREACRCIEREREDRESNWTKVAIGSDDSEVEGFYFAQMDLIYSGSDSARLKSRASR
jgi:hypothetical protein